MTSAKNLATQARLRAYELGFRTIGDRHGYFLSRFELDQFFYDSGLNPGMTAANRNERQWLEYGDAFRFEDSTLDGEPVTWFPIRESQCNEAAWMAKELGFQLESLIGFEPSPSFVFKEDAKGGTAKIDIMLSVFREFGADGLREEEAIKLGVDKGLTEEESRRAFRQMYDAGEIFKRPDQIWRMA